MKLQSDTDKAAQSSTLATLAYERIRRDIVRGTLPPGEKLRVEVLRQRYDIGGSPLREALNRLAAEGLVSQQDQKGFRVSPLGADELRELTRTRCMVNEVALRESIARGGRAWEEAVVLACYRLSREQARLAEAPHELNPAWDVLHKAFHTALISACGSRDLIGFSQLLFDRAECYRQLQATVAYGKRDTKSEHQAIVDAAIGRDAPQAITLLNEHIQRTTDLVLGALRPIREAVATAA